MSTPSMSINDLDWWCCTEDYPNHRPSCKNYRPPSIHLPRDLAEHACEYLADLIGEWEWKRGERAGNGEQYDALVECRRRMAEALGQADGKEVGE